MTWSLFPDRVFIPAKTSSVVGKGSTGGILRTSDILNQTNMENYVVQQRRSSGIGIY
jgi:hypothetical protein